MMPDFGPALGAPQPPTLWDRLQGIGSQIGQWYKAQPSWLEQAQAANESGDWRKLNPTDQQIQFAMGMVGPTALGTRAVPLAMDNASRMARAAEQGFTRDAYHGTGEGITGDALTAAHPNRYDSGYMGSGGVYSTNQPFLANSYATLKAQKLRPMDEAPNVLPLKLKMENPKIITGEEKKAISGLNPDERNAWLNSVYSAGHDGVMVKYNKGYEEYLAPSNQYRSRFAAFDPKNIGNPYLLGSVAGLGALPLLSSDQK
jgi:hypothetical protein